MAKGAGDKAVKTVSGQGAKASTGGGGTIGNPPVKKVKGQGNRSVAAISTKATTKVVQARTSAQKRIPGGTKQNAGHLVKQTPKTTQGQRGTPGPATRPSKVKGAKASKGY